MHAQQPITLAVPVVAEQQRDIVCQACGFHAHRGLCQLLFAQGQANDVAACRCASDIRGVRIRAMPGMPFVLQ